jgi:hypothetical protein
VQGQVGGDRNPELQYNQLQLHHHPRLEAIFMYLYLLLKIKTDTKDDDPMDMVTANIMQSSPLAMTTANEN